MPRFNVGMGEIIAFDFGNTYLFIAYFDENQLINHLEKCYNKDKYCFKILEDSPKEVQQTLANYFYELAIEDSQKVLCRRRRRNRYKRGTKQLTNEKTTPDHNITR